MLTDDDLSFIAEHPVARLATADGAGKPHVVPVCYVVLGDSLYITIDAKPKSGDPHRLKRLRNLAQNPNASIVIDHYDHEDWSALGWLMVRGEAEILVDGEAHAAAQLALRARYRQYRDMPLEDLPVIAIRIKTVTRWGYVA